MHKDGWLRLVPVLIQATNYFFFCADVFGSVIGPKRAGFLRRAMKRFIPITHELVYYDGLTTRCTALAKR